MQQKFSQTVTTRERYLAQLQETAMVMSSGQLISQGPIEAWAKRSLEQLERQGRLVTEQQFRDRRRVFKVGDRARYVGEDRAEQVSGEAYVRPHGQTGQITQAKPVGGEYLITFTPDATAATQHIVALQVRTNTPGYFALERVL